MEKRAAGLVIFRLLNQQVEYLMLQTSYGNHHWTPPKGHVDPGETDELTAIRETEEEAGISEKDVIIYADSKCTTSYYVGSGLKIVTYWLAQLKDPLFKVRLSDEHQDFKWLNSKDAQEIGQFKQMEEVLASCEDYINTKIKNTNK